MKLKLKLKLSIATTAACAVVAAVSVGTAIAATSAVFGSDAPHIKPGLWDVRPVPIKVPGASVTFPGFKSCVLGNIDKNYGVDEGCTRKSFVLTKDGFEADVACTSEGETELRHYSVHGDFSARYLSVVTTKMADGQQTSLEADAIYRGPCGPDDERVDR